MNVWQIAALRAGAVALAVGVLVAIVVVLARPGSSTPAGPATTPASDPTAAPTRGELFRPHVNTAFTRFSKSVAGTVEIAVAPLGSGPGATFGGKRAEHAWSTSKVPVLVALMRAQGSLTAHEQSLAKRAITASDNQSVLDLFADLERSQGGLIGASTYIESVLQLAGDTTTQVATAPPPPGAVTTFGQTEWTPSASAKFFRGLGRGCLLPSAQSAYVLGLMEHIEPSESWGLGAANFTVPVAFKGGWGPEPTGYLVRQSGIIDPGTTRGLAVSIVARPRDGTFAGGTQILTQTARWLRYELRLITHPPAASCAGA